MYRLYSISSKGYVSAYDNELFNTFFTTFKLLLRHTQSKFKVLQKHSYFSSCSQTMCYTFSIQKIARIDISCLWTTKHNPYFKTSPQNMFLLIHVSFNFFFSILLHMTEKAENTRSSWGENKTDLFCFGQTFHKRNLLLLWKPTQIASGHRLFLSYHSLLGMVFVIILLYSPNIISSIINVP